MNSIRFFQFRDSSVLHSCFWDEDTESLIVMFHSGAIWRYENISHDVFFSFKLSKSAGQFFNANIRNSFPSICLFKKGDPSFSSEVLNGQEK